MKNEQLGINVNQEDQVQLLDFERNNNRVCHSGSKINIL